jgi:prepilin-type N-terminal cleavage/methylation domain-containing protein
MRKRTNRSQDGFTMVETVVVVALALIVMGFAVINTMSSTYNAKSNAAMDALISQLRQAREMAIAKRRNVEVTFTAPNEIQLTVLTLPGEAVPTPITPVFLNDNVPGGLQFYVFSSLPDTPMAFGNSQAINLQQPTGGGAWSVMFTTSGALVGIQLREGRPFRRGHGDPGDTRSPGKKGERSDHQAEPEPHRPPVFL